MVTREEIIKAFIELDSKSEKPIGAKALQEKGINEYWVYKLIPEGSKKHPRIKPLSIVKLRFFSNKFLDKVIKDLLAVSKSYANLKGNQYFS